MLNAEVGSGVEAVVVVVERVVAEVFGYVAVVFGWTVSAPRASEGQDHEFEHAILACLLLVWSNSIRTLCRAVS